MDGKIDWEMGGKRLHQHWRGGQRTEAGSTAAKAGMFAFRLVGLIRHRSLKTVLTCLHLYTVPYVPTGAKR